MSLAHHSTDVVELLPGERIVSARVEVTKETVHFPVNIDFIIFDAIWNEIEIFKVENKTIWILLLSLKVIFKSDLKN